jgi:hypothetical protein
VIVGISGRLPRHDCHVQTTIEHLLMQPITFSDQSCDPVSHNAVSYLFTDGYSDSVTAKAVPTHIQDQISVYVGFSGAIALSELFCFFKRFHFLSVFFFQFWAELLLKEKATLLRLKLIISFNLLLFWLSGPFFRRVCSFLL